MRNILLPPIPRCLKWVFWGREKNRQNLGEEDFDTAQEE